MTLLSLRLWDSRGDAKSVDLGLFFYLSFSTTSMPEIGQTGSSRGKVTDESMGPDINEVWEQAASRLHTVKDSTG